VTHEEPAPEPEPPAPAPEPEPPASAPEPKIELPEPDSSPIQDFSMLDFNDEVPVPKPPPDDNQYMDIKPEDSGRLCKVCGAPQFHMSRSGWTCENGHGGADYVEVEKKSDSPPKKENPILSSEDLIESVPDLPKTPEEKSKSENLEILNWIIRVPLNKYNAKKLQAVCMLSDGDTPLKITLPNGKTLIDIGGGIKVNKQEFQMLARLFGLG
jgi:hypothetical protein